MAASGKGKALHDRDSLLGAMTALDEQSLWFGRGAGLCLDRRKLRRPCQLAQGRDAIAAWKPVEGRMNLGRRSPGGDEREIGLGILALSDQRLCPDPSLVFRARGQPGGERFG